MCLCCNYNFIDCGRILAPVNSYVSTTETVFNTTVHFTCTYGYELHGNANIRCNEDGKWSSDLPVCDLVGK